MLRRWAAGPRERLLATLAQERAWCLSHRPPTSLPATVPQGATIVVRGGSDTVQKLRSHAERTARAWSLDGRPLFGISVFAVLDMPLEDLLRKRFTNFRSIHLHTGYVWTFLDEARDPSQISPGAIVIAGDEETAVVCQVIDLVPAGDGTIVHLRLLPGLVEDYQALVERSVAS
jgi:hypothetical protein